MAAGQRSRGTLDENTIQQIVKDEIAGRTPEIERVADAAVERSAWDDETLRAEKTAADAFSAVPRVISAACVRREGASGRCSSSATATSRGALPRR